MTTIMGIRENWALFIETTKNKSKGHSNAAQYWDSIGTYLSLLLIVLGAVTTFMALINTIPPPVVAGIAAVATMMSAVSALLKPSDRRQIQSAAAREFQELMLRMVRCEEESEYEELWRDLNKAVVDAPFLSKKFKLDSDIEWTMTPEFDKLIQEKEGDQVETPSIADGKINFGYGALNNHQDEQKLPQKGTNEHVELLVQNH